VEAANACMAMQQYRDAADLLETVRRGLHP
jgi:hypothetical protein